MSPVNPRESATHVAKGAGVEVEMQPVPDVLMQPPVLEESEEEEVATIKSWPSLRSESVYS